MVLLASGCATAIPRPLGAPCLPPGLPPLAAWRAVEAEPVVLVDAERRPVLAVMVMYAVGDRAMRAWWIGSALVTVDPHATEPEVPLWFDAGFIDATGALRANGAPTCDWRQRGGARARTGQRGSG